MSTAQKRAFVTGASRGIGRAVCEALLSRGRTVVACARDAAALAAFAQEHPGRVLPLAIDLAEHGAPEWAAEQALALAGDIDELVCAAGIVRYAHIGHVRETDLRDQLNVNFVAPFLLTQRLGMHMREREKGAVVHVASTLGLRPAPQTAAYAASKAALLNATRTFAVELAPHVRVNAVAPGVVDTDMVRVPREGDPVDPVERARAIDEQLKKLSTLHPLGRLGTKEEVAETVLFLLDASWITGSVVTVDGGLTAC